MFHDAGRGFPHVRVFTGDFAFSGDLAKAFPTDKVDDSLQQHKCRQLVQLELIKASQVKRGQWASWKIRERGWRTWELASRVIAGALTKAGTCDAGTWQWSEKPPTKNPNVPLLLPLLSLPLSSLAHISRSFSCPTPFLKSKR